MHIVLLCGGAGKRLWPLSNELRSKLFVDILPSPGGGRESMISRVCRQLDSSDLLDSTLIISHQNQTDITTRHTKGKIPVIGEPFKRGTFTAAALASLYLKSYGAAEPDDMICIAPADVFADENFFRSFKLLPEILKQSHADIILIGTRPTYASEQYGYILPGKKEPNGYAPVTQFIEKPELDVAETLLQHGALWNCGVYAFSLAFMLSHIEKNGLPVHYEQLLTLYEQLPERSFDKQVAEQSQRAVVLPYEGVWQDIGSWDALCDQLDSNVLGHGRISESSPDSYIVNELPYPIHVIGVPGIITVASPDGILIANKKDSNEIKEQLGSIPLQPMYVEATWGSYRVMERAVEDENTTVTTLNMTLLPGKHIGLRKHRLGCRAWTVISGSGQVLINGQIRQVTTGNQFAITLNSLFSILAETRMVILEVQLGVPENEVSMPYEAEDWKVMIELAGSYKSPD
ncbi:sugar phosphate nucleotidyltransferase [Paenibacillus sp. 7523-1]|uniref:sugar phosphate nucleotidyltransferase n=1 Tax=Paenibacillus sp. 7523-1 TaxID=2022550 RepID=UPI000BA762C4|nr:sugar phosphate nucleotidyltransferase [Paenibacillus sp. 7523-1]PAD33124.1 mannose-1-phosphate guanylyltransferase [Paenibacillus sp. 7523-1]